MTFRLFESSLNDVTRLVLIRHGQIDANLEDRLSTRDAIPLNAVGVEQARRTARRVETLGIQHLYASPQRRATQTAEIIGEHLGLEVRPAPDIMEFDFGELAGMTLEEVGERYPDTYAAMMAWLRMGVVETMARPVPPGGETIDEFAARIARFKDSILAQHPGQVVAAVTHLATIKVLLTLTVRGDLKAPTAFMADNASVSVVDFRNGMPTIRLFNDIHHLDMPLKYGRHSLI